MANDFDIMCDEIYVDYKPIEPSEDYDPIADMLYTLGLRWTSVLTNRFDSTAFKKEYNELYKRFTKQISSRRFSIVQEKPLAYTPTKATGKELTTTPNGVGT